MYEFQSAYYPAASKFDLDQFGNPGEVVLFDNNTYMPGVKRTVFNLQTEKKVVDDKGRAKTVKLANPRMTTTILFDDNTSVTVQNADDDPVEVETVEIDGKKVMTASRRSKELAFIHGIAKRLICPIGENGNCTGGYGRTLKRFVDEAYDQPVEQAKAAAAAKEKKAAWEKAKAAAKAKPKKYTLDDIIQLLGPALESARADAANVAKLLAETIEKADKKSPAKRKDK